MRAMSKVAFLAHAAWHDRERGRWPEEAHVARNEYDLAAIKKNLEALGFLLAEDVVEGLKGLSPLQVDAFYQRLVKDLRTMVGAHRQFKPMYPNFPAQVMEMSEAELYFNAIIHYWTQQLPDYEVEEREPLADKPKYRLIRLGTREDFESIFTLLARSKSPFSQQDQEDVKWFVAQYRDGIKRLLPDAIPCKENLAVLGADLLTKRFDVLARRTMAGHGNSRGSFDGNDNERLRVSGLPRLTATKGGSTARTMPGEG